MLFRRSDRDVEMPPADLIRLLKGEVGDQFGKPRRDLIGGEAAMIAAHRRIGELALV